MKDDEKSACKEIGDCSSRERCFVVTPISSEGDPIRRHIDGVNAGHLLWILQRFRPSGRPAGRNV